MRITATPLAGAAVIDLELKSDERGFFARTFCREEFAEAGLEPMVEQCNLSYNHLAGTLRGMHYQVAPGTEAKLVRCTAGAILDVIVDVRPGSPTYLQSFGVELTADNRSYKVDFSKIHTQLPGFSCDWDADRGAQQLAEVFSAIDLDKETFTGRGHTRLKQLEHLLRTNQVDADLFWTSP